MPCRYFEDWWWQWHWTKFVTFTRCYVVHTNYYYCESRIKGRSSLISVAGVSQAQRKELLSLFLQEHTSSLREWAKCVPKYLNITNDLEFDCVTGTILASACLIRSNNCHISSFGKYWFLKLKILYALACLFTFYKLEFISTTCET